MDKIKFKNHLNNSTKQLIEFAKTQCFNNFSPNYKYIITPNSRNVSENESYLTKFETSVLETWNKYEGELLEADKVIDLLHRDNLVPVWINISVQESKLDMTVIELLCSRRLKEEKELMHPGSPPFHVIITSPLSRSFESKQEKFDVNWKLKNQKKVRLKARLNRFFKFFK